MNSVRNAWQEGRPTIGTWHGLLTQLEAERLGQLGYDWLVLDLESSGLHWDTVIPLMQAVELGGTRTMVRVPVNDPTQIGRALDYGAIGVIVPMVSTPDEARRAAAATRYPPRGTRGNGQLRRAYASHADANKDVVCIVMIETAEGMRNLDGIAATDGVDAIMIGQVDLGLSLGWDLPRGKQLNIARHEQALNALSRVVESTTRHDKVAAAAAVGCTDEDARSLLSLGIRWFAYQDHDFGAADRQRDLLAGWRSLTGDT